jgi:hypothetical protein
VPFLKGGKHMLFKILLLILALLPHQYGTVTAKTYEGYDKSNDRYIIRSDDGDYYSIIADDLEPEDRVTIYYFNGNPIRTIYGER